jgi:hypothetical protein
MDELNEPLKAELELVKAQPDIKLEVKPLSEAEKFAKLAEENPEAVKIENQSAADQVEFASRFFRLYNKQFVSMINQMNKKAAARVITRLVAYPLETPDKLTWVSNDEKNAFLIGNQLIETKYMLFKYVAMGEAEKAQLAKEPLKTEVKLEGEKVDGKV